MAARHSSYWRKRKWNHRVTRNNAGSARVESVHRALVLLKLIHEQGSISVTEAAGQLDIHPATAQRLLVTLVGDDFARQGEKRRYYPGSAFLRTSGQVISLRDRLRPSLEQLFDSTKETVHVGTLIGTEVHHPDGIESPHPLRFGLRVGARVPAHTASAGKAMLAELPWDEVKARYDVATQGNRGVSPRIDLAYLHDQLEETKQRGYATNFEESEPGIAAFAVSVGRIDGQHSALSVAMPVARYTDALGETLVQDLVAMRLRVLQESAQ